MILISSKNLRLSAFVVKKIYKQGRYHGNHSMSSSFICRETHNHDHKEIVPCPYDSSQLKLKLAHPIRLYSTSETLASKQSPKTDNTKSTSKILFDGDCKICQVEISALKMITRKRDNIEFVDISSPDYDKQLWGGVSYEDAMKEMHVVGPDGKVYTQGDAIREMYRACGFGWLASLTDLPLIKPVCNNLYLRFAEYRLRKALDRCDSNTCDIKLKNLRDKLEKEKNPK